MHNYTKVKIIFKESRSHEEYNKRIIDYLKDRHTILNDNYFIIQPIIATENDINGFIKKGVRSLPAMKIDGEDEFIFGVNSIIATLAQMEQPVVQQVQQVQPLQDIKKTNDEIIRNKILEEMMNTEEEGEEVQPSKYGTTESPMSDTDFDEKMKKMTAIYDARKQDANQRKPVRHNTGNKINSQSRNNNQQVQAQYISPNAGLKDIIKNSNFDNIEKMMLQQSLRG